VQKPQAQNIYQANLWTPVTGPPERPCDKLDPVLLSALTQESFVFEPAERIRQNPRQIEPMLSVPEQVIGPIVDRKFENRKGLA